MAGEETIPYGRSPSRGAPSFEHRSFSTGPKLPPKTATDKLVWFSPIRSPLLSPGRDKTMQITKKKPRQSSIFSIPSRSKGAIEADEPTSPKVSCIGQVRGAQKKPKDPLMDASKKKPPQWKPGSTSPARFFSSPGRSSKWGSLFGSRKEGSSTPNLTGYGGDYEPEKQSFSAGPLREFHGQFDPHSHSRSYDHTLSSKPNTNAFMHSLARTSDADKLVGSEKSMEQQHFHTKSRQRLTYEELPSLYCGPCGKQNMKISVEVVPETWMRRDGEKLRPDGMSHVHSVPEGRTSVSREELAKAQEDVVSMGASSGHAGHSSTTTEAKECLGPQHTSCKCQDAHALRNYKEVGVSLDSGTKCESIRFDDEKSLLHYAHILKESKENATSLCCTDRANASQDDKGQALHSGKQATLQREGYFLGSVEVNTGLKAPTKRSSSHDVRKQSHGLGLPEPVEKKKLNAGCKESRAVWGVFKDKKSQATPPSQYSTLILVGYGPHNEATSLKSVGRKVNAEEILKGVLEVGRVSFHGREKLFRVVKRDMEFIRSRSATTHRTVIRLQRCNSDPCRPPSS